MHFCHTGIHLTVKALILRVKSSNEACVRLASREQPYICVVLLFLFSFILHVHSKKSTSHLFDLQNTNMSD